MAGMRYRPVAPVLAKVKVGVGDPAVPTANAGAPLQANTIEAVVVVAALSVWS